MDKELKALVDQGKSRGHDVTLSVDRDNAASNQVTLNLPDGPSPYTLKLLDQLYETRPEISSIDPQDREYIPLLLAIEGAIADAYRANASVTDGHVMLALKPLSMNPAAPCGNDPLCQAIQLSLRLCLSMNPYSKQEVKLALRKVIQSVQRHTRLAGTQGFVTFIIDYC
jgi:hypothetical protein